MNKIKYVVKRLMTEYKNLHKPGRKELVLDTCRIMGTAFLAAGVLKIVDTGFAAALGLFLR